MTHDTPVVSRITQASANKPYLAVIVSLNREVPTGLSHDARPADERNPCALRVGDADVQLVDALGRYLRALGTLVDTEGLAGLATREIHYRLLTAPLSRTLRQLALGEPLAEPVQQAIGDIRRDLAAQLSVHPIASHARLSTSAFQHHFRTITGATRVQLQKQLCRRLMTVLCPVRHRRRLPRRRHEPDAVRS